MRFEKGKGKFKMRGPQTLKLVALFFCMSMMCYSQAYAVAEGLYIGFSTGPATNASGVQNVQLFQCVNPAACGPCIGCNVNTNTPTGGPPYFRFATVPGKPTSNQWGSRLYMGYMFNEYAGIEFGFNYFSGINYNFKIPPGPPTNPFKTCGGATVRIRDLDLSGKFAIPIQWFDAFVKAGVAATYQTVSGGISSPVTKTTNCNPCSNTHPCMAGCPGNGTTTYQSCGNATYVNKYNPLLAIGATFDLTQSWVADVTYMTILTSGPAKSMSTIQVGIAYHFVNVYCGQFLCDD